MSEIAGTCDGCKHWRRNERHWNNTDEEITKGFNRHPGDETELARRLAKAAEEDRWGRCVMMDGPTWEERAEGTLAVAEDGSSYHSHVLTRENFGCVMHKKGRSR